MQLTSAMPAAAAAPPRKEVGSAQNMGMAGDDADHGEVHADSGESGAAGALSAEDEADGGDDAGDDDVPAAFAECGRSCGR